MLIGPICGEKKGFFFFSRFDYISFLSPDRAGGWTAIIGSGPEFGGFPSGEKSKPAGQV
jgi:hypothetical protein